MYPRLVRTWKVSTYHEVRWLEVAPGVVVRGIFARRDIPAGKVLEQCPVAPVYAGERNIDVVQRYAWDWPTYDGDERVTRDAIVFGYAAIINHATGDAANTEVRTHTDEFYAEVVTTRRITAGDELLHDYGWDDEPGKGRFRNIDRFMRPVTAEQPATHDDVDDGLLFELD